MPEEGRFRFMHFQQEPAAAKQVAFTGEDLSRIAGLHGVMILNGGLKFFIGPGTYHTAHKYNSCFAN